MVGMLIVFAVVGGFVVLACRDSDEHFVKPALRKARLARLARIATNKITLDQAEDGVVLSRQFGEHDLEKRFTAVVKSLRARRPKK
jgi:hypothetical protein